jgi:hypothetical protein
MRGKDLDVLIENELQIMLVEGFEKSPISPKELHTRLKNKGIINGGLSTLSTVTRKQLIMAYTATQLTPLNLKSKEKQQYINRKTRDALIARNKRLQDEISELKEQLSQNTRSVIDIVKSVKMTTVIPVESLLAIHVIRELHKERK